jgi:hypothetical protein
MVSIILRGGLGNQLFQYATGRAHSLRTNSSLFVDPSTLDSNHGPDVAKRSLHLEAFDLPVEYVGTETSYSFGRTIRRRIPQVIASVNQLLATRLFKLYVEDKSLTFDPRVPHLSGNVTLDGYWQSERYFAEFTDTLRREITVRNPVSGENQQWYDLISDTGSVSIHVRRGDYVDLGWALPPTYYRNALDRIHCTSDATNLFFFSDDMDWVQDNREELVPDHRDYDVHYVECNDGETAHEDLRLMRACDHHVVANSSFSWWGAWLDDSETKHVVAPDYWVHDSVNNLDIVPNRWYTSSW